MAPCFLTFNSSRELRLSHSLRACEMLPMRRAERAILNVYSRVKRIRKVGEDEIKRKPPSTDGTESGICHARLPTPPCHKRRRGVCGQHLAACSQSHSCPHVADKSVENPQHNITFANLISESNSANVWQTRRFFIMPL